MFVDEMVLQYINERPFMAKMFHLEFRLAGNEHMSSQNCPSRTHDLYDYDTMPPVPRDGDYIDFATGSKVSGQHCPQGTVMHTAYSYQDDGSVWIYVHYRFPVGKEFEKRHHE